MGKKRKYAAFKGVMKHSTLQKPNKKQKIETKAGEAVFEVRIGHIRQKFMVTKREACSSSRYFNAMFGEHVTGPRAWKETMTNIIELPDVGPKPFQIYTYFLKRRQITGQQPNFQCRNNQNSDIWMRLAQCYVLGDRLLDSAFKDAVVDACIKRSYDNRPRLSALPSPRVVTYVYENTLQECALRRLLADLWAYYPRNNTWVKNSWITFDKEFLHDLCERVLSRSQDPLPEDTKKWDFCSYHEHPAQSGSCPASKSS